MPKVTLALKRTESEKVTRVKLLDQEIGVLHEFEVLRPTELSTITFFGMESVRRLKAKILLRKWLAF